MMRVLFRCLKCATIALSTAMMGCAFLSNRSSEFLTDIKEFRSPSIEVVEFDNLLECARNHIPSASGAESVCVVRICDTAASQPTYADLFVAFYNNYSVVRLIFPVEGRLIELKPACRSGRDLKAIMKRIDQNPLARYRRLAGALAKWLDGGESEDLIGAIDEAATDYMIFYRPNIRVIVQSKQMYDWANGYHINMELSGEASAREIIGSLNELIEHETGRAGVITYRPQEREIKMTLFLPRRMALGDVLKLIVNMPEMIASRARLIYEEGRIIIDHEFADSHCCPRKH